MSHIGEEAIVTLSMKMEAFAIFITMKSIKGTGKIARNVETSSENMNSNTELRIGRTLKTYLWKEKITCRMKSKSG